jgi:DNA polymerase-1
VTGLALANGTGDAAWIDPAALGPEDDAAVAAWLADPKMPKVLHDAKGPMLALAARGWRSTGSSATPRSPPTSRGPTSAPTISPTSRPLPQARAQDRPGSTTGRTTGTSSASTASATTPRARPRCSRRAPVLDLAEALDDELDDRGGTALLGDVELRWWAC